MYPINEFYKLASLKEKIKSYGKENLQEILYFVTEGIELITGWPSCHIYLEDLTEGLLICAYARGKRSSDIQGTSIFINPQLSLLSNAFINKECYMESSSDEVKVEDEFTKRTGIKSAVIIPIICEGKSIGVIGLDRGIEGRLITEQELKVLKDFIADIADCINFARRYHQQILFSRQLDNARKKEAAFLMVRSAVKLLEKLALASVLTPTYGLPPLTRSDGEKERNYLEILASYSRDFFHKAIYEDRGKVSIQKGESLIGQLVEIHPKYGVVVAEKLLNPLCFQDVKEEEVFQKREIAGKIGLSSLYMVPRYDQNTKKLICIVNYYTKEIYKFTPFERTLLESHAEVVERVIQEISNEHIEIRVLSEINELLMEKNESLQPFLTKILSKACELIGADTGTIALVSNIDGNKWLLVEDNEGRVVGAKSREWMKKSIPPIKIGDEGLDYSERSLTGLATYLKEPMILNNTEEEKAGRGFYKEISPGIKSELVVPILVDEEVIAVINLDSFHEAHFTEEHKSILMIIARLVGRHIKDLRKIDELKEEVKKLKHDIEYRDPNVSSYRLGNIIGNSPKSQEIIRFINAVVPYLYNRISSWEKDTDMEATLGLPSILITGETGSGKEFIFNHIYSMLNEMHCKEKGVRAQIPLKKTNIAAYSGDLTYSELFGHKKGSFTGAISDRRGILEESNGGVVFLDEIGDADHKTQVQLLRFLDNGGFIRLGENHTRSSKVLLVASTNRNLKELIRQGKFREDLYYRLSELTIEVPSLNERRMDVPDLATHFLGKLYLTYKGQEEDEKQAPYLDEQAKEVLLNHNFQGNVRELRSILLRAIFYHTQRRIGKNDIVKAISSLGRHESREDHKEFKERVALELYDDIVNNGKDFWSAIHRPYSRNYICQDTVRKVLELAKKEVGNSLPKIAVRLKACRADFSQDPKENKKFISFKNFLYKTIRITTDNIKVIDHENN